MMKTNLNMEERSLSELHPAEYNPRIALTPEDEEYQRIMRSIQQLFHQLPKASRIV